MDRKLPDNLRVAIVHYWLTGYAGGERVLSYLAEMFPEANLFTLVADPQVAARYEPHRVNTSFLQRLPGGRKFYRHMLPLTPLALEQFDLRGYDLVISSESGPAKGVITAEDTLHICYCHSPMRYLWGMYPEYVRGKDMSALSRLAFRAVAHYLRLWDFASAARVDAFVANSRHTAARIRKIYRREAAVIHPPVEVAECYVSKSSEGYYLVVGRLVDYKRVDLAVEACTGMHRALRVVGAGPQCARLKSLAGPTVEFLGELNDSELHEQYAHCRALLFPGQEDFGIVPVEAHSFGRPVIAYGKGGALETVQGDFSGEAEIDSATNGILFREQTTASLVEAIQAFEASEHLFSPENIARGARRFSAERFRREMTEFIAGQLADFQSAGRRQPLAASGRG
jgi:glycosyltransferase involved in cell wall biosynthesis